jgi:hypothetical protein
MSDWFIGYVVGYVVGSVWGWIACSNLRARRATRDR